MSSAAPGLGRERERERELAESQLGAGDWERSQPSSRPSAALSALSDHTEQHNGKMLAHTHTSTIPLLRSLLFSFSLLAVFVSYSVFRETSLTFVLLTGCLFSCISLIHSPFVQSPVIFSIHPRFTGACSFFNPLPEPHPLTFPPLVTRDGPYAVALQATALNQRKQRGKHGFRHRHPQTGSARINMHML